MEAQTYALAAGGFVAVMIVLFAQRNQRRNKLRGDKSLRPAHYRFDQTERLWFRQPRWYRHQDQETGPWR